MASLAIVSTSRSRHRQSPDVAVLVADLCRQHGKRASAALYDLLIEDEIVARAIAEFVVERLAVAAPRRRVMPSAKERAEHQVAEKVAVTKLVEKVREVALLDLIMPNGIAMRFNTGTQMGAYGKAYEAIATKVGDAMVGEVMVEAEVKAFLRAT
jgi:hypothetical protein